MDSLERDAGRDADYLEYLQPELIELKGLIDQYDGCDIKDDKRQEIEDRISKSLGWIRSNILGEPPPPDDEPINSPPRREKW